MSETREVHFDSELLLHIECGRNDAAKSMLNEDLAKASDISGTLLHYAAMCNNEVIARFLIELGGDVDSLGLSGRETPLMTAVKFRRALAVKVLLEANADVDIVNADGQSALQKVFSPGYTNLPILLAFFHRLRAIESSTIEEVVERLLEAGCTLYHAALVRDVEAMKALLQCGSDVNWRDCQGKTALHHAAVGANGYETAQLLVDHDADVDALDERGKSPLYYAVLYRNVDVVSLLLERLTMLEMMATPNSKSTVRFTEFVDYLNTSRLQRYCDICVRMLKITVFWTMSLLDLLTTSEYKMRLYVRNETFVIIVEGNCSEHDLSKFCPYYYDKLMRRISHATDMVKLEDEAIPVISDIFRKNRNECYVAAREIAGYLNKRDLEQLCRV